MFLSLINHNGLAYKYKFIDGFLDLLLLCYKILKCVGWSRFDRWKALDSSSLIKF